MGHVVKFELQGSGPGWHVGGYVKHSSIDFSATATEELARLHDAIEAFARSTFETF